MKIALQDSIAIVTMCSNKDQCLGLFFQERENMLESCCP